MTKRWKPPKRGKLKRRNPVALALSEPKFRPRVTVNRKKEAKKKGELDG